MSTDDVEQFFTKQAGYNLKPLFDLYLRTTNKLEVHVKALPGNKYLIQLQNIDMKLPLDVGTDSGVKHLTVDAKGLRVESKSMPAIDPEVFYLKKIIIE